MKGELVVKQPPIRRGVTLEAGDIRVYVRPREAQFVLVGPRGGETFLFLLTRVGMARIEELMSVVKSEMEALEPRVVGNAPA